MVSIIILIFVMTNINYIIMKKLPLKNYDFVPDYFTFELSEDGTWNCVDFENKTDEVEETIGKMVEVWGEKDYIPLGEKTTGSVWKHKDFFKVVGEVCVEVGEDYDDDVWEDFKTKISFY